MKALIVLALVAMAGEDVGDTVRFITCPVYRDADSGKKSGCWLADDRATGARYDVSLSPSKPDWNREVLVEGKITAAPQTPCGGVVLDAVRTSVLPGFCTRQMLPAESHPGRKFVLPKRNLTPLSVARTPPPGPYAARTFRLFFDFDQSFLIYQYDDYFLDNAIDWLRAAKPKSIVVTGYAATLPSTVSGRTMAEDPSVARARAEKIGEALTRMGIEKGIVTLRWKVAAAPVVADEADGLTEASRRRVDIAATF